MQITSTAFKEGETIPKQYTADGKDMSPPLKWSAGPKETKSYALICDDPDAPRGTWVHWVVFNIPAQTLELPEGWSAKGSSGAVQGVNDFKKPGYGGPSPPAGKPHRYFFRVFALDKVLDLKEGATRQQLDQAMDGRILAQEELMGKFGR